jgi:hypothetical protein
LPHPYELPVVSCLILVGFVFSEPSSAREDARALRWIKRDGCRERMRDVSKWIV